MASAVALSACAADTAEQTPLRFDADGLGVPITTFCGNPSETQDVFNNEKWHCRADKTRYIYVEKQDPLLLEWLRYAREKILAGADPVAWPVQVFVNLNEPKNVFTGNVELLDSEGRPTNFYRYDPRERPVDSQAWAYGYIPIERFQSADGESFARLENQRVPFIEVAIIPVDPLAPNNVYYPFRVFR